ncbi:soma ferritin, partial [Basidiobolus meristosporus CBS 931.73]
MSLAKQNFATASEDLLNQQIVLKYTSHYIHLSASAYFGGCDVALPGLEKYFKKISDKEYEDAWKIIDYQNKRGGVVQLAPIASPKAEWESAYSVFEASLSLKKEVNQSLIATSIHGLQVEDPALVNFIKSNFLTQEVQMVSELAHYT